VRPDATPAGDGATPAAGFEIVGSDDAEGKTPTQATSSPPYVFRTTILDTGFEHPRLDAATQATISWRNTGQQTHSVVSDEGTFAGSGPIAPGSSYEFTFQTVGDYAYHCRYHPDMKGLVVVR
jgi:plastocyanin